MVETTGLEPVPSACKADALPAELCFHLAGILPVWQLKSIIKDIREKVNPFFIVKIVFLSIWKFKKFF